MADVAARVPDFAGLYVDDASDTLYVMATQATASVGDSARQALREIFGVKAIPAGSLVTRSASYRFRDLKDWYDRLWSEVLSIPGSISSDIDEKGNRIAFGVEDPSMQGPAVLALARSKGIPTAAVRIDRMSPVVPTATLASRWRPIRGGLRIQFKKTSTVIEFCSVGIVAVRSGVRGFVTNSHCSPTAGALDSNNYAQPNITLSADLIGHETNDPLHFTGSPCPSGRVCRYSDSNFSSLNSGVDWRQGQIARPALNTATWNGLDYFDVSFEEAPMVDKTVTMVGSTSGRRQGKVTASCMNANSTSGRTYLCQGMALYTAAGGDSGAPVFRITNLPSANSVYIDGIHWGVSGSLSVFSPIANVERPGELGPMDVCDAGFFC